MVNTIVPTTLVIIGITGDLTKRKLLPAIEQIAAAGELPKEFKVIGITRQQITVSQILKSLSTVELKGYPFLKKHLELFQMDLDKLDGFISLKKKLDELYPNETQTQHLFYLAIPPQISSPVIELLGKSGIASLPGTKLLLEKPFGSDLISAQTLVKHIKKYFTEDKVYRIDHYLAKEMAQNIFVFRNGNSLFKHTWNKNFIEKIEIIASEKIGIEGRTTFYEQTGALRDLVQSHLLQLAALVLMELPENSSLATVPHLRHKALASLLPPKVEQIKTLVHRAQYESYSQEVNNPGSTIETFVSLTLFSKDKRWQGVPITLTTGKALDIKATEIRIHYRKQQAEEANQLILRIQPNEGIEFDLWIKKPGYNRQLEHIPLSFSYFDHFTLFPEAYEQVIFDAIRSEHTLFTSSAEVIASWKILQPILHAWSLDHEDLKLYKLGSKLTDIL